MGRGCLLAVLAAALLFPAQVATAQVQGGVKGGGPLKMREPWICGACTAGIHWVLAADSNFALITSTCRSWSGSSARVALVSMSWLGRP